MDQTRRSTLIAAVDRIIPADDFPSASQAGAVEFITRLLDGDLCTVAVQFYDGLDALNAEAIAREDQPFASLPEAKQDSLLEAISANETVADWPQSPSSFFDLLIRLTGEGYYSNPGNGGNRDGMSWKMIGYDPGANGNS